MLAAHPNPASALRSYASASDLRHCRWSNHHQHYDAPTSPLSSGSKRVGSHCSLLAATEIANTQQQREASSSSSSSARRQPPSLPPGVHDFFIFSAAAAGGGGACGDGPSATTTRSEVSRRSGGNDVDVEPPMPKKEEEVPRTITSEATTRECRRRLRRTKTLPRRLRPEAAGDASTGRSKVVPVVTPTTTDDEDFFLYSPSSSSPKKDATNDKFLLTARNSLHVPAADAATATVSLAREGRGEDDQGQEEEEAHNGCGKEESQRIFVDEEQNNGDNRQQPHPTTHEAVSSNDPLLPRAVTTAPSLRPSSGTEEEGMGKAPVALFEDSNSRPNEAPEALYNNAALLSINATAEAKSHAKALLGAVQEEDWSTVLERIELRPEACSLPVRPFRFRGESSVATLLHEACARCPPLDVVDAIVTAHPDSVRMAEREEAGAAPAGGRLPVHVAIAGGASAAVVRYLLGVCLDGWHDDGDGGEGRRRWTDRDGNTVLHYAASFGTDEVLNAVLEAAVESATSRRYCCRPSSLPSSSSSQCRRDAPTGTTPGTYGVGVANKKGRTPLHVLCARCGFEGGDEEGASSGNSPQNIGDGAPMSAAETAIRLETVRHLLEVDPGAVRRRDRSGRVPLHDACGTYRPRPDVVDLLLDAEGGAEAAASKDSAGRTPLALLRTVRPGLVPSPSSQWLESFRTRKKEKAARSSDDGDDDLRRTLARLVRMTPDECRFGGGEMMRGVIKKAFVVPSRTAGRAVRRSLSRHRRRRRCGRPDSIGPSGRGLASRLEGGSDYDDVGTYPRHASPVTTVKKSYTLPY